MNADRNIEMLMLHLPLLRFASAVQDEELLTEKHKPVTKFTQKQLLHVDWKLLHP